MIYKLPLSIKRGTESVAIVDADRKTLCYFHFENELSRKRLVGRLTESEAVALAKRIARFLTDTNIPGEA